MSFDDIDKKYNKSAGVKLIRGPMFWVPDDPDQSYDNLDDILDDYGSGDIVRLEEGGITREFYAVSMPVLGTGGLDNEIRQFATLAEAEIWVKERDRVLDEEPTKET